MEQPLNKASFRKKTWYSRGGCRVAEAKSNSFRARLSMSGSSGMGHGGVRGGVVLLVFLLKSEEDGNPWINEQVSQKKILCVCGTNHLEGFQNYVVFNFSSSYLKEDSNMDQEPIKYLFLDHHQVLTMYIHIPSGPFLDDHASRIKEDGFFDQNSKFWMFH